MFLFTYWLGLTDHSFIMPYIVTFFAQLLACLAVALCLLVPAYETAPAPSPQFPTDLLIYAAIGKYIIGSGVGLGKCKLSLCVILHFFTDLIQQERKALKPLV